MDICRIANSYAVLCACRTSRVSLYVELYFNRTPAFVYELGYDASSLLLNSNFDKARMRGARAVLIGWKYINERR